MGCIDGIWLLESGKFSDFTIVCQNTEFRVHKLILKVHCGYFAALFESNMKEAQEGVVEFDDIDPKVMNHLVKFFYDDDQDLEFKSEDLETSVRVWILADRLQAKPAMREIETRLMNYLKDCQHKTAVDKRLLDMVFSHPACAKSAVGNIFAEAAWVIFNNEEHRCRSQILAASTKYPELARIMLVWSWTYAEGGVSVNLSKPLKSLNSPYGEIWRESSITLTKLED